MTHSYPTPQTEEEAKAQKQFAEKILKQYQREGVSEGDPAYDEIKKQLALVEKLFGTK